MSTRRFHLESQPIPEGYEIVEERLEVAGIKHRKDDARAFANASNGWLELERDPANQYDPNAIKVLGCTKGLFGTKRRFIGFVPKNVAKAIVVGGHANVVRPRLLKTYVGDLGFVEILFQILGPRGSKHSLRPASELSDVERIERLVHEARVEEAIGELLKTIDKEERTVARSGMGVAPWYYEKLAILYRKQHRYDDEVAILERYDSQPKAPGAGVTKLAERLVKAREVRERKRPK